MCFYEGFPCAQTLLLYFYRPEGIKGFTSFILGLVVISSNSSIMSGEEEAQEQQQQTRQEETPAAETAPEEAPLSGATTSTSRAGQIHPHNVVIYSDCVNLQDSCVSLLT